MVIKHKKYHSGEATQFMSRKAALKKLQLNLKDFRRLCILKGIYPREPRNLKRAQKGHFTRRTLYHKKDIQFLMHESIIKKFREIKVFNKKVSRARTMNNRAEMKRYLNNHPQLKIDHIVKERYPTFIDALRDLDDCLSLCFLFSTFPSLPHIPRDQSMLCRRLTTEFMNAVIAAKALRKVFISIKGYYYQAEIKGQNITWIVPHHFSFEPQAKADVDFKIMSTFVEFYIIMLGFVNYRLYNSLNLLYPPNFTSNENSAKDLVDEDAFVSERIAALNAPLMPLNATNDDNEDLEIDDFSNGKEMNKDMEALKEEAAKVQKLKTLFKGLKFFINREVPREPLVFVLRCFGAEVSWDKLLFIGSTFDENDETITHQIVDRPSMEKKYMSRYYIQPQWVYDSVNARELLPVEKYFMGCILPPHLSPFTDNRHTQTYIPPEERILLDPEYKLKNGEEDEEDEVESMEDDENEVESMEDENENEEEKNKSVDEDEDEDESNEEDDDNDSVIDKAEKEYNKELNRKNALKSSKIIDKVEKECNKESDREKAIKPSKVVKSEVIKEVPWEKTREEKQAYRLREKMIKKKHRNLYKSMMKGRQERAKEIWLLRKKRRLHEEAEKEQRKHQKKNKK